MAQRPWTPEEIKFLEDNYPDKGKEFCAKALNRGLGSIRWKCSELKLRIDQTGSIMTEAHKKQGLAHKGIKRPAQSLVMKRLHKEGKLKKNEEQLKKMGERTKEQFRKNGHPRGMLGKHQTDYAKKRTSETSKKTWSDPNHYLNSEEYRQSISDRIYADFKAGKRNWQNAHSRSNSGKREDINGGQFFRSTWEANYARYLNWLVAQGQIFKWEYETDTFYFEQIKRGTRSYTPDFKIWETENSKSYYVEVKGWMDQKSRTKLARMAKYYPEEKIVLFQKEDYKALSKWARIIPGWE